MSAFNANQKGFSVLEVLLVVVALGAVVFIGYQVMNRSSKPVVSPNTSANSSASQPAKITSKADLRKTATVLDSTNVNSIDLSQLDSDLNSLL